jgi:hypothetical protein
LIARQDKAIPPEADRFTAQRRNADTREVDSSHLAITSQPDNVTDMIIDAVRCGALEVATFSGRPASTHAVLAQELDHLDEGPRRQGRHPPPRR